MTEIEKIYMQEDLLRKSVWLNMFDSELWMEDGSDNEDNGDEWNVNEDGKFTIPVSEQYAYLYTKLLEKCKNKQKLESLKGEGLEVLIDTVLKSKTPDSKGYSECLNKLDEVTKALIKSKEELSVSESYLDGAKDTIIRLEQQKEELIREHREFVAELEKVKAEREKLGNDIIRVVSELAKYSNNLKTSSFEIEELIYAIKLTHANIESLTREIKKLEAELERAHASGERNKKEKSEDEKEIEQLREQLEESVQKRGDLVTKINKERYKSSTLKGKILELENEKEELAKEIRTTKVRLDEANDGKMYCEEELEKSKEIIKSLKVHKEQLSDDITMRQNKLQKVIKENKGRLDEVIVLITSTISQETKDVIETSRKKVFPEEEEMEADNIMLCFTTIIYELYRGLEDQKAEKNTSVLKCRKLERQIDTLSAELEKIEMNSTVDSNVTSFDHDKISALISENTSLDRDIVVANEELINFREKIERSWSMHSVKPSEESIKLGKRLIRGTLVERPAMAGFTKLEITYSKLLEAQKMRQTQKLKNNNKIHEILGLQEKMTRTTKRKSTRRNEGPEEKKKAFVEETES